MQNKAAYVSFALLFVVGTILTQVPQGQEAEVRSQKSESEPRSTTPVGTGPQGSGGLSVSQRGTQEVSKQQLVESYGRLPLSFEANHGQSDGSVKFLSRGNGYTLFLTANEAVLALRKPQKSEARSQESEEKQILRSAQDDNPRAGHPPIMHTSPDVIPRSPALRDDEGPALSSQSAPSAKSADETAVLRLKLVGANPNPEAEGEDELPGKSNYFIGNDPSKWRTNVPTYAKVRYKNVYPGIDLVYYGEPAPIPNRGQRQLEYDFVVAPGADPRAIRLAFQSRDSEGAVPLRIDGQGDLVLEARPGSPERAGAEGSELRLHQPVIYQEIGGTRQRIGGNFVISDATANEGGREVGFEVARYDARKPLIIDPVLSYSTYLGGSDYETGFGIAVDSSGNAYVTGSTSSTNFPTANAFEAAHSGSRDAFVTKLNAAGSALVYSTYLGGSGEDLGYGIAVDSSGNAYVTGSTSFTNFPTTANAFQAAYGGLGDAFVTKLNAAGSALVYSTYLGGSRYDQGNGIAVDSSGDAYVTGSTQSTNFPTKNAFQATYSGGNCCLGDAFVTKLNAAGSALVYSTYLGGSGGFSGDEGSGIAVDPSGNAYVTGYTDSNNFPTKNAFQAVFGGGRYGDAFVTRLNAAGSGLIYSTYLGGSGGDSGHGIAVDPSGNAYVTGYTDSNNFPTKNAFQASLRGSSSAFVTKLNAAGSALVYSTYLGGSGGAVGSGIAVDPAGNAYVTGYTRSADFPTANAFQATYGGGGDAFVTKFPGVTAGALAPPQLTQGAVVNGASFAAGAPVAPGSIASAFGLNFASSLLPASSLPLPTFLGGATVRVNGISAPLFAVSTQQINFQIPWELSGQSQAFLTVTVDGVTSSAATVSLTSFRPGLFAINQQGTGQGAILVGNTAIVAAPVGTVSGARPVIRGAESISIYCTGLGPVTNPPASGTAAPTFPPSLTTTLPTVTVGGIPATVSFSGLAPGFAGLYQVNIQVPQNAPTGDAVPVVLTIGGVTSNPVTIAVQ